MADKRSPVDADGVAAAEDGKDVDAAGEAADGGDLRGGEAGRVEGEAGGRGVGAVRVGRRGRSGGGGSAIDRGVCGAWDDVGGVEDVEAEVDVGLAHGGFLGDGQRGTGEGAVWMRTSRAPST